MAKWHICFNRGTKDWSQAWVIEELDVAGIRSGRQHVVSGVEINGALAETSTAPDGCPQGYLVVTGDLILADRKAKFVVESKI